MKQRKQHRPRWTKDEVAYLKQHYRTKSNLEIATALGRKVSSVVFKGFRLGLSKGSRRLKEMGRENIAKRWNDPAAHLPRKRSKKTTKKAA